MLRLIPITSTIVILMQNFYLLNNGDKMKTTARYKGSLQYDFTYPDDIHGKSRSVREGCGEITLSGNTIEEIMLDATTEMMKCEVDKNINMIRFGINIFVSD